MVGILLVLWVLWGWSSFSYVSFREGMIFKFPFSRQESSMLCDPEIQLFWSMLRVLRILNHPKQNHLIIIIYILIEISMILYNIYIHLFNVTHPEFKMNYIESDNWNLVSTSMACLLPKIEPVSCWGGVWPKRVNPNGWSEWCSLGREWELIIFFITPLKNKTSLK